MPSGAVSWPDGWRRRRTSCWTWLPRSTAGRWSPTSPLMSASTLTYAWFIQPYLIEIDFPLPLFGVIWTLLNITVGTSSMFAYKIERRFAQKQTMCFIYISIAVGFILTGCFVSIWALPILFLFYIVRGIATPLLKDYIHVLIDSDVRATVLSLRNMFIRIIFAIIGQIGRAHV